MTRSETLGACGAGGIECRACPSGQMCVDQRCTSATTDACSVRSISGGGIEDTCSGNDIT